VSAEKTYPRSGCDVVVNGERCRHTCNMSGPTSVTPKKDGRSRPWQQALVRNLPSPGPASGCPRFQG